MDTHDAPEKYSDEDEFARVRFMPGTAQAYSRWREIKTGKVYNIHTSENPNTMEESSIIGEHEDCERFMRVLRTARWFRDIDLEDLDTPDEFVTDEHYDQWEQKTEMFRVIAVQYMTPEGLGWRKAWGLIFYDSTDQRSAEMFEASLPYVLHSCGASRLVRFLYI